MSQERRSKVVEIYSIKNFSKLTIWGRTDKSSISARFWEERHRNKEANLSKNTLLKILANWPFGEKTDKSSITARVWEEGCRNQETNLLIQTVLKILENWPFGEKQKIKFYSSCPWSGLQDQGSKVVDPRSIKNFSKLTIWGETEKSCITALVWEEGCRIEEAKLSKHSIKNSSNLTICGNRDK